MNRKSPWVLYSAIVFLLCAGGLACSDATIYPVKRIAYYIGAWMGCGSDVVEEPCVWIECYEPIAGTIMSGLVLCFLTIIYWSAYNRNGRSAVALLAKGKTISSYVGFVILLSLCLFIGMEEITFVKAVGLLVMPPVFYVIICDGCNIKPLTRYAVAMSVCGILFYFIFSAPLVIKVVTLSLSVLLSLYVSIKTHNRRVSIMESMSGYLVDVTYGEPFYSMQPMQFNGDICNWYEATLPELDIDYDILVNEKIHASSDSVKTTEGDIYSFFWQFKPQTPGAYNCMWHEIKPTFFDWRFARDKFAEGFPPHQRLSFEEHTGDMMNRLFKEIKSLKETRNDNVIYDHQNNVKK